MPNGEDRRPLLFGGENLREEVDRTSGRGGKYHPFTFEEAAERLLPQIAEVEAEVEEMPETVRGARIVFEAKLLPNYLAASYFPAPLLEATGLHSVGSRYATGVYMTRTREEERLTKSLLLAGTERELRGLRTLLEQPGPDLSRNLREAVLEFSEVYLPSSERVVRRPREDEIGDSEQHGAEDARIWEAVLHRVWGENSEEVLGQQDEIFEKWEGFVAGLGGEVVNRYRRVVSGLTFVPIRLPEEQLEEVARFNPLRFLRPMPRLRPIPSIPFRAVAGPAPIPRPPGSTPRSEHRIAVFDGGVDPASPFVSPFVTQVDLVGDPPDPRGLEHGSAVTNTILYGHHSNDSMVRLPNLFVDHFRMFPVPAAERNDYELNWLLDQIVSKVGGSDYRVVNLSLGPQLCVEDNGEPSRWTAELDSLAHEEGVLFVSAAGNNGECAPGLDRVQVPGDMVNGMAVGAADTRTSTTRFNRTAYSAKGPGRWGARIQPLGVCFGGDLPDAPFVAIGPTGDLRETAGTSFATPLAVHGLTDLIAELGEGRMNDPQLLRGFAAHFAHRRSRHHRVEEFGIGLLRDGYRDLMDCGENSVTVVYQDLLHRDGVAGFTFPVPEGLDPESRVHIRWTLTYSTAVDPAESMDYTQAGVVATFRPHMRRIPVTDPDGERIGVFDIHDQREEFEAALLEGGTPSSSPDTDSGREIRLDEQRQRDAGKWETLQHHRFSRKASALHLPRLDLAYYQREGGTLVGADDADHLPISLIVTLRGEEGSNFYDLVRQQFETLIPAPIEIEI